MGQDKVDFDVIQIGYGPVSKASALFLARNGWRVGVFERWEELYPLPRAVCIDHELYRVLHAAGLGDVATEVCQDAPRYQWFNSDWQELLSIDWAAGSISGGPEVNFVNQPNLERALHERVTTENRISLHLHSEAIAISQDDDHVKVTIRNADTGETRNYTTRYLIGVDGANSFVRESLGIGQTDFGFEADWLVIDIALKEGLTARDLGIPLAGQYCNPTRPTTIVPGGLQADGRVLRRWEFMRLPNETKKEMRADAKVWELLEDWIKPDQGELVRHALYTFRSLIADRFQERRIFIAGDAAHVMPPFMGQGMCAGLRDVWNLSWKLNLVLSGKANPKLLENYTAERASHVRDIIKISMFLGEIICIPDAEDARRRDEMFLSGTAPRPAPFPILTDGLLYRDSESQPLAPAGALSCAGTVRHNGITERYDTFVGSDNFVLAVSGLTVSPTVRELCSAMSISVVEIAPRQIASADQIGDTQGQFIRFFEEKDVKAMLVRPDFYIYGGAKDAQSLEELLNHFQKTYSALTTRTPEQMHEPA